ncbi:zinc finger protein 425-like [Syngnathus typhle]|uniref:zinc finger protein 425-like n=1 Tax=Syngnathus typhle TaxID=161592 RepID=UPI002A69C25F|nr:zinc finger protein 425-like [Syngnathus typhle]
MSKTQMLRTLVLQRLNVAVEEIFQLFENTIAEYEEEFCRAKENNVRLQGEQLAHSDVAASFDVQPLVDNQEEEPANSSCVKVEEQNIWSSQDAEQLPALKEEPHVNMLPPPDVQLKSEEDKGQPSQPCHSQQINRGGRMPRRCKGKHSQSGSYDSGNMMSRSSKSDRSNHPKEAQKTRKIPKGDLAHHARKKEIICPECGKVFVHRGTFNRHARTHTGEKPFGCDRCVKRFYTTSDLKIHMRRHTGEKPFACPLCPRRFPVKWNRDMHIRAKHTGEKPFACSICPQRFTCKSAIKHHMKVKHADGKLFNCSLCPKTFCCKSYVIIHMRTHTGEKAFSCNVCTQGFSYKYQLKKHRCAVVEADTLSLHTNA